MHQGQAIDVVGSLVALATSVVRLELRLDAARARAAQLGPVLVGDSVNVIAGLVERVTRDGDGNLGYVLGNLLLSAAESSVRAERASWVERAAPGLLDAAIASIGTVPDGRVYQEACDIADRLVSDAWARGDMDALSVWLTYGGKLRFVPYGVQIGRATEYGSAYQAWQARLRHHLADHEPGVQADTVAMPSPQQSVSAAIPLLREAASLHGGQRRGWQLKLVVQALDLLERVGGQVSSGEIVANAKEALHLLDRRHDPAGFVNLLFILARHGAPEPLDATMLPPVPLDRCLAEFGLVSTGDMLRLSLDVALDAGRPDVVRAVLRDARKILPQLPEQNRLFILVAAMHALPGDRTACPKGPLDPTERERDLDSRAEREGWSPRELAAALAHLGVHAGHVNQPFVGLGLLVRARELDADYHDGNSSSAGYVEAQLAYQAAIQELER